jgi:hypothetical protein
MRNSVFLRGELSDGSGAARADDRLVSEFVL